MALPIDVRRELIREEVAAWKEQDHGFRSFNNFHANLPGGGWRRKCEIMGQIDIVNRDVGKNSKSVIQKTDNMSDTWWNQTSRQFFQEIDTTIIDLGISIDRIQDLQRAHDEIIMQDPMLTDKQIRKKAVAILNQIYELTEPVFIELRAKGYSHQDLAV